MSVVVPTHQRRDQLDAVLDELLANVAPAELVIVDDGSTDGTAEMLAARAAREPRLRPIAQANQGAGAARLAGVRHARGEVVVLLDDDVVPAPGVVARHAVRHAADPSLVLVGYMPVAAGPRDARSYPREAYARTYEAHVRGWEEAPGSVLGSLWAGHLSVRRDAYLAVAPQLEQDVASYHTDLLLGLRLEAAGLHGEFDRTLTSVHHYVRSPEGFVRDAASSGRGLVDAHERHADRLGALDLAVLTDDLPRPAAWLVLRARVASWPRRLLDAAIVALGLAHAYTLQRFAGRLQWRMVQQQEMLARLRELHG
ncbi:glycosyltransferase family 2 protein [Baekduia soli]|uniref:glycosyltransferase family 2 protein n=1 Tax=Baekduia soli TaxID=496014 RepID=UPI001E43B4F1|nr:glycosyltransferase family 2 protein [Baekduia soli]